MPRSPWTTSREGQVSREDRKSVVTARERPDSINSVPVRHKRPPYLNDMKAFFSWMVPKADMHGRMNAAEPMDDVQGRTSVTGGQEVRSDCPRAAGLNKFSAGST